MNFVNLHYFDSEFQNLDLIVVAKYQTWYQIEELIDSTKFLDFDFLLLIRFQIFRFPEFDGFQINEFHYASCHLKLVEFFHYDLLDFAISYFDFVFGNLFVQHAVAARLRFAAWAHNHDLSLVAWINFAEENDFHQDSTDFEEFEHPFPTISWNFFSSMCSEFWEIDCFKSDSPSF